MFAVMVHLVKINFVLYVMVPQTINSFSISVDDDTTKIGSGQSASINFVTAVEIEEYDPTITQIGDPDQEPLSRLKPTFF